MARDLKEDFFRLDGAWASFELMSIRQREDYLKPFIAAIDDTVADPQRICPWEMLWIFLRNLSGDYQTSLAHFGNGPLDIGP
jgi:hypothetical protein